MKILFSLTFFEIFEVSLKIDSIIDSIDCCIYWRRESRIESDSGKRAKK
jgi:hypothetical protein